MTTRSSSTRAVGAVMCLIGAAATTGCSTTGGRSAGQRLDPFENWNRSVFSFNEKLDENVLKPVATVYSNVVPRPVRTGVDNFFGNAADAWSAVNSLLQGKFTNALNGVIRVGTNTVFGVGGLLDVATEFGLEPQREDLGQTLGRWGIGAGAYLVWPLLGPSSVRDSVALPFDRLATPAVLINNGGEQLSITLLQIINTRANLLGASRVLDDIALDKYTFVRDAYLQRRRSLVFDGDAPPLPDEQTPQSPVQPVPPLPLAPQSPASAPAR